MDKIYQSKLNRDSYKKERERELHEYSNILESIIFVNLERIEILEIWNDGSSRESILVFRARKNKRVDKCYNLICL